MGLSSSKQKTKTNETVTPVTPPWIAEPIQGFTGKVTDFVNSDPSQYVASASPLQEQAFTAAQNLGSWKPAMDQALSLANSGGTAPASTVDFNGYDAPQLGQAVQAEGVNIGPAAQAQAAQAQFHSILDGGGIQRYVDPAIQSYVDAALAQFDATRGQESAAMAAQAARNQAFGGSRYGITEGQFAADTARGRALTEAELRARAYEQAVQAALGEAGIRSNIDMTNAGLATQISGLNAQQINDRAQAQAAMDWNRVVANQGASNQFKLAQAGFDESAAQFGANAANQEAATNASLQEQAYQRALEAAGISSGIGAATGQLELGDLGMVADLGEMQRAIEQAQLNAPLTQLQAAAQLYGAIPYSAFVGQNSTGTSTTKSSPSLGGLLGQAAQTAAVAFSDRRLKRDIRRVGSFKGIPVHQFRYLWDDPQAEPRVGVMADEVATVAPHALGPVIGGYATVDYSRL